ncbi:PAS domain-containing protein [Aureimonas sp. AU40]|uniref:PAS domain-containing protein n=1 Tax=Aureimonas sp. AU40 TaxID=1637747 RepID=UPI000781C30A|nr:PAS domain-containing protein [Aureimonas sp. AU40]
MDRPETDTTTIGMPDGMTTAALAKLPLALVLTNPHLDDNPIVYANQAFARISRYTVEAVIGRNCRFLQGPDTDPDAVRQIGEALREERDITIDLLNYRADGTKFLNRLLITPLYDTSGQLQCFLGVQRDLSNGQDADAAEVETGVLRGDTSLGEIQHRVKNHLAMIIGMIRMQSRAHTSGEAFDTLARRIESLQLLYQEMTEAGVGSTRSQRIPLGAYISRIASTIGYLDGRRSVRVNVDCDAIDIDVERAARIGLLFSELLTNALKHAFKGRDEGLVEARLKMLSSGVIRLTVTDDGIGLPPAAHWPHGAETKSSGGQRVGEAVAMSREGDVAREVATSLAQASGGRLQARAETDGEAVEEASEPPARGAGGLGGRIVLSLVRGLEARIDVSSQTSGTTVTVDIPGESPS